jgi:hypothetical protein
MLSPEEAHQRASIAAHESWARTPDRSARTAPARDARWKKYLEKARALAPPGADQTDIARRAEHLRQADLKRMAYLSARSRRMGKAA